LNSLICNIITESNTSNNNIPPTITNKSNKGIMEGLLIEALPDLISHLVSIIGDYLQEISIAVDSEEILEIMKKMRQNV
jgi:hypothetical protein